MSILTWLACAPKLFFYLSVTIPQSSVFDGEELPVQREAIVFPVHHCEYKDSKHCNDGVGSRDQSIGRIAANFGGF